MRDPVRRDRFDYTLPPELIASRPPTERDGARLLVLANEGLQHRTIRDLPALLPEGALVVVNDTKVVPARLFGKKRGSGGRVELLLVRNLAANDGCERWEALGRASKALRPGTLVDIEPAGALLATIERAGDGTVDVTLTPTGGHTVASALNLVGHMPLPPYMRRDDDADDRVRYQTTFARVPGAVAAPTAGLHLSEALLEALRARGLGFAHVTLHVGLGTFRPVETEDLDDHVMHAESFAVPETTALAITRARSEGRAVVAIGTTVVRTLESAADPERPGHVLATTGDTRLLIQPGFRFRVVDHLLTNFHLPQSTLLALVSAFAGRERVLDAYAEAVKAGYRFFSYGDAMLLRRDAEVAA